MANSCLNTLEIYSSENEEQLQQFIEAVKDTEYGMELSFDKLLPCPTELLDMKLPSSEMVLKYGHKDFDSWCWANWGTNSEVEADAEPHIVFGGYAIYKFYSAWSPPIEWIVAIAKMFPELSFTLKYDEPGLCFMGVCTACGDHFFHERIEY